VPGVPLRRWLAPSATDSVAVNAAYGGLGDLTEDRPQEIVCRGSRVLKVKVGLEPPEVDLQQLRDLAHRLPSGVSLRLDANGTCSGPVGGCAAGAHLVRGEDDTAATEQGDR